MTNFMTSKQGKFYCTFPMGRPLIIYNNVKSRVHMVKLMTSITFLSSDKAASPLILLTMPLNSWGHIL